MFLKQALSHNFVSLNGSCVLTQYKNTQIRAPESGHATVKYFTGIVTLKFFLKLPCPIFSSIIAVLSASMIKRDLISCS